jgi:hypothetical protein
LSRALFCTKIKRKKGREKDILMWQSGFLPRGMDTCSGKVGKNVFYWRRIFVEDDEKR